MATPARGPSVKTPDKKRIASLDGIRGVCAMIVVTTHVAFSTFVLPSSAGPPTEGIWSILWAGQVGAIGPFFIMSGLFLYRPFARATLAGTPQPRLGIYLVRRASRLLPAFWVLCAFSLIVLNLSSITGVWDVLRPFLLLHIYDFHWYAGLDVAWTVPAETQFYIALPIIAWVMHRLARGVADPARKARRMLIPLGLLVVVQLGWALYINSSFGPWPPQFFYPFGVSGLFAIGMAMAVWSVLTEVSPDKAPKFFSWATKRPNLFWLAALVPYVINCAQPFSIPGTADWLSPEAAVIRSALMLIFSFLVMVPLVVPGASSRLMEVSLGNWPLRFLGRISYGLYLWHFAVMYLVFQSGSIFGETVPVQALLGKFGFWELLVPTVVGTIVIATISYYVLERPILKLTDRLGKKKTAPSVATSEAGKPAPEFTSSGAGRP
ncbi:acyltransferase family protein [Streptosporangium canum]|uniref:acyltransferase family protein n=1 Tax=Streptosporangium canum TaxID=324952 RepID=UPI00369338A9